MERLGRNVINDHEFLARTEEDDFYVPTAQQIFEITGRVWGYGHNLRLSTVLAGANTSLYQEKCVDRKIENMTQLDGLLKNGGVAVLVGEKASNIDSEFREHRQLVFWDSVDPSARRKELPSNTKIVLLTRFCSHEWHKRIRTEANKRGILFLPKLHSTGELKKALQEMLKIDVVENRVISVTNESSKEQITELSKASTTQTPESFKTITDFIAYFADFEAENLAIEGDRLLKLWNSTHSKQTNIRSFRQAMRYVNNKLGLAPVTIGRPRKKVFKLKAPETTAPETKAPETTAPETKAPETKAPETKAPETKAPETQAPESDQVLRLITDAIAGLELAREQYENTLKRNKELEERHATLKQALGLN